MGLHKVKPSLTSNQISTIAHQSKEFLIFIDQLEITTTSTLLANFDKIKTPKQFPILEWKNKDAPHRNPLM